MAEAPGPLRATASVVANRNDGGANHRLELELSGWPGFAPGQFAMLSPGAVGEVFRSDPLLPRPMAIYRETGPDRFEILYKRTGGGIFSAISSEIPNSSIRTRARPDSGSGTLWTCLFPPMVTRSPKATAANPFGWFILM